MAIVVPPTFFSSWSELHRDDFIIQFVVIELVNRPLGISGVLVDNHSSSFGFPEIVQDQFAFGQIPDFGEQFVEFLTRELHW